MKIHIVSTINGLENEGMRNIATHLSKEFEKNNTVYHSPLKSVGKIIVNAKKADVTFVFVRLVKSAYFLCRLISLFSKKLCLVCVQPVSEDFARLNKKHKIKKCTCFSICKQDAENAFDTSDIRVIPVGINQHKFSPAQKDADNDDLRTALDLPHDRTIVLHVGHCSHGRGLEDMLLLDSAKYHCIVVASGMFDDTQIVEKLRSGGVDVRFGFVKNIEDYYRLADVYLFPTKSSEYVISVPLSVMEALSCATPVVAYDSFKKILAIQTNSENAITRIKDNNELCSAIDHAALYKSEKSYLKDPKSWAQISNNILSFLGDK